LIGALTSLDKKKIMRLSVKCLQSGAVDPELLGKEVEGSEGCSEMRDIWMYNPSHGTLECIRRTHHYETQIGGLDLVGEASQKVNSILSSFKIKLDSRNGRLVGLPRAIV
jgi:hypothetical protein